MEFTEKFKTYTHTELLRILNNSQDYQPNAVDAAKSIFLERNLTDEEIKIAADELEVEKQEKLNKAQKKAAVEDTVKKIGESILQNINPIQNKEATSNRTIIIISAVLGVLFLIRLFSEFEMLAFIFFESPANWDFSMVLYFLPLIIIPTALILFYKRLKMGWILLTLYFTFNAVSAIGLFMLTLNMEPIGIPELNDIFPTPSPTIHLLTFLFSAAIIWIICRENIRAIFTISKQTMILTISITAAIVTLGIMAFF